MNTKSHEHQYSENKMVSKMKYILSIALVCFTSSMYAQEPFKELGLDNEVEVITLSNGRYIEHFENDTLRQIGSVMFNMTTNKVEYVIPEDDLKKVRIAQRDREVSRFLSIDPVAHLQTSYSPYLFAGNSPIYYIDFDGGFKWPGTAEEQKILENKYPNITKLMKNVHKLADEYPTLLQSMADNSGLTVDQIKANLQYGSGAEIIVVPHSERAILKGQIARTPNEKKILIHEDLINDVENASGDALFEGMFALGIVLIHEEVHRGDRITNQGDVTGQWDSKKVKMPEGTKREYVYTGGDDMEPGKQKVKMSKTGHRGHDVETQVFNAPLGTPSLGGSAGFSVNTDNSVDRSTVMKRNPNMTADKLKEIFK